jgi:hypothetical protein
VGDRAHLSKVLDRGASFLGCDDGRVLNNEAHCTMRKVALGRLAVEVDYRVGSYRHLGPPSGHKQLV